MDAIMPYVWILIFLLAVIAETLSHKLIVIWLAPAAAIALLLGWLECDVWLQSLVFVAVAVALIVISALVRRSRHSGDDSVGGPGSTIGKTGRVIERIDNLAGSGQVEVSGQFWAARAINADVTFEVGTTVEVFAVEGVKLICR